MTNPELSGKILFPKLSYAIVGCGMEVHRVLDPGFNESVYESALAHEFTSQQIKFERQVPLRVQYKSIIAGDFRADFVVDGKIILEIKAIKALTRIEEGQVLNYLKGTKLRLGILLNFGELSLKYQRVIL